MAHDHPTRRDLFRNATAAGVLGLAAHHNATTAAESSSKPAHATKPIIGPIVTHKPLVVDVVVIGGGMAGVCAALSAARNGATVALVQDRPVLGGNASSEIRLHIHGADDAGLRTETEGRESGIIERIRLEEAVTNPQKSSSMFDLLLYDLVRNEPNITCLLNTHCCGVKMADKRTIAAIQASRYGTEELFTIAGRQFIDCSGDGRCAADAGADYRVGREAQNEYGESLAPPVADRKTLGSTILFQTRPHERPMPFTPPRWVHRFKDCSELPHRRHDHGWKCGYWWVEWGGEMDTIKDGAQIRDDLLAYALGLWDHIKNSGHHPESENWALQWLGFLPGKRESRRFLGDYVLNQNDLQRGETFSDGVAFGGWPIDLHPPGGIESSEPPCDQTRIPLYNIPLRCLRSRNINNLMLAGRNISASHVAFASTRVMATCAVMGQAVGTAAALCVRHKIGPNILNHEMMNDLQQQLLKDDAYIIGITNSDPADLARKAMAIATSQQPQAPAAAALDGIRRRVGTEQHCWMSAVGQPLPQWIELRWNQPIRPREIHLIFDSNLQRPLMLTWSDWINQKIVRGPQPELVRDYRIQLGDGQAFRTVAEVAGNYQRHCVHEITPHTCDRLRLHITATNGDPVARLFEIRVYE